MWCAYGALAFWLTSTPGNAQQLDQPEQQPSSKQNVYNSDDLFSARYDPIVDTRARGDSQAAMERLEELLKMLTEARESSQRDTDGEERWLITLALRANLLRDLNRNDESLEAHRQLLKVTAAGTDKAERLLHLEVQQNYSTTLFQAGKREQALTEIGSVLRDYEDLVTRYPDDLTVAIQSTTASNNFGVALVRIGQHREALAILQKAIELLRGIEGESQSRDRKLATLLLNAGVAAAYVGDPTEARRYLEESLKLKDALGELNTQEGVRAQITLGAILGRLNQYREAAESYRLAVIQLRQLYPPDRYPDGTLDLAIALDNRSVSLVRLKEFDDAREYAIEANQMFGNLARKSPGLRIYYARSSANLALLNARTGKAAEAVANLDAAMAAFEEMFPRGHAEIPGLYRSKAIILSELRREAESIATAQQALQLARDFFPPDIYPVGHNVLAQALDTTGVIYLAAGQPATAGEYFLQAVQMQAALAENTLRYISEAESLQFLAVLDSFKSHLLSVPVAPEESYRALVGDKARILDQQKRRFHLARQVTDSEMAELAERYEQVRTELARRLLAPKAGPESADNVAQLQAAREDIERRIAELGADSAQEIAVQASAIIGADRAANWNALLKKIPADTAVVEFFSYEHFSIDDTGATRRTAGDQKISAFVVTADGRITRVDFGDALALRDHVRQLVAAMPLDAEQQPLETVSQVICPPLLEAVPSDCSQLVLIPDGITGGIPYACLIHPRTQLPLVSRFQLVCQSSLDRLGTPSPTITQSSHVVAVGGVDYGPVSEDAPIKFAELPGTAKEVEFVQQQFARGTAQVLTGGEVTWQSMLDVLPQANVIHLATHAYVTDFARGAVTNNDLNTGAVRISADQRSPLLAARVALSGANQLADDPSAVVTGERFAAADLDEVELVVLSACESGVGERVLGEGVFGLQRAFHVAGASHVVATLWPVADAEAVVFMEHFYRSLLGDGSSPAAALRQAQLAMMSRESTPGAGGLRRGIKFDIAGESDQPTRNEAEANTKTMPSSDRSTWAAFFLSRD